MSFKKLFVLFALVDFSILTVVALWQQGFPGMIELATGTWMGRTLAADLCIALTLVSVWLYRDATEHGRNPWPFLLLTAGTGSVGPLLYLLLRPEQESTAPRVAQASV